MTKAVTIGRQYGSAGHDIGELIAKELGYKLYDKELVELAAKKSNISETTLRSIDEKATSSLLYSLASGSYSVRGMSGPLYYEMPINDKLFIAQSDVIKAAAKEENCVIIGRCADYVLSEEKDIDLLSVFIYAPLDWRAGRVAEAYNLPMRKARERTVKTDKQRKTYYGYYSSFDWGDMKNYDLCINSSKLGIEGAARLIIDYLRGTEA